MAGTIVVDRIESDASYASTINVAGQITFSNTVNFGVTSGAPVAGFYSPSTNNLAFTTASTERMRIDASGNMGIGTDAPTNSLHIARNSPSILIQDINGATTEATGYIDFIDSSASRIGYIGYASTLNSDLDINVTQNANIDFLTNNTRQMSLTSAGLLQFNSGFGSVATAYGCRAWVNFNGTGTVAIRESGNVTSITDNGTGDYTVNFTTAMTDVKYAACFGAKSPTTGTIDSINLQEHPTVAATTSAFRVVFFRQSTGAFIDRANGYVAILR
jgi:hypothetical protein